MEREFTEWTNSWWDDANHPNKRRWLLIGDSVHRDCRGHLQNLIKPLNISLDFYATSFHIEDAGFKREIEHFFSYTEYAYEIIFIGWGGHHGYARHTLQDSSVRASYKKSYEELLEYVMERCSQVVILASTPVVTPGKLEELHSSYNPEVIERNIIANEIAQNYGLPFVDQYKFVMEHREQIKHRDTKHFVQPVAYQMIVQDLYDFMIKDGILTSDGQLSDKVRKKKGNSFWRLVDGKEEERGKQIVDNHIETCVRPEMFWMQRYRDMAEDADWLKKKAVFAGTDEGPEVGYAYLYVLLRLLEEFHPKQILEFNFGQATRISAQYAAGNGGKLTVLEHDRSRVEHFMRCWPLNWAGTEIQGSKLLKVRGHGVEGWYYSNFPKVIEGKRYNLLLFKCPFGGGRSSFPHVELSTDITSVLADDFAILMDHIEDKNVEEVFVKIAKSIEEMGITFVRRDFSSYCHRIGLLVSETWRYVEEY